MEKKPVTTVDLEYESSHRWRIVQAKLWLMKHQPACPGCLEPIRQEGRSFDEIRRGGMDFHHTIWRDGDAYHPAVKLALIDQRNGVLAHPACHSMEGTHFQVLATAMLFQMHGIDYLANYRAWVEQAGPRKTPLYLPKHALLVCAELQKPNVPTKPCPKCGAGHMHFHIVNHYQAKDKHRCWWVCWRCFYAMRA